MSPSVQPSDVDPRFTPKKIAEAYALISNSLHKTPILTSTQINDLTAPSPLSIYFKAEVFQKSGAFKIRGASHAITRLPPSSLEKGVITHSSGNHSAALARAARERNVKCQVVMPANASKLKVDATRGYGAEIIFVENPADRAKICAQLAAETGATFIPPYDHADIILGQGTVMYEFQRQMMEDFHTGLDAVVIPVGGGGLLAGCAVACIGSGIKVFGAEPQLADDCERGIRQGSRARLETTPTTIADGLRTEVGELNFGIIQNHVRRILTVSEEEIALAMKIVIERLKVVIEPSAAVAVAVVLFNPTFKEIVDREGINTVGIVLEGGNVDTGSYEKMMPWIHLTKSTS